MQLKLVSFLRIGPFQQQAPIRYETVAENSATKRVDYWVLTILLSMGRGPVIVLGGKERPLVNVFMSRRNMKMQILKKSWRIV